MGVSHRHRHHRPLITGRRTLLLLPSWTEEQYDDDHQRKICVTEPEAKEPTVHQLASFPRAVVVVTGLLLSTLLLTTSPGGFAHAAPLAAADDSPDSGYKPPWSREDQQQQPHLPAVHPYSTNIVHQDTTSGHQESNSNERFVLLNNNVFKPDFVPAIVARSRTQDTFFNTSARLTASAKHDYYMDTEVFGSENDVNAGRVASNKAKRHHLLANETRKELVESNPCLGDPCVHGVCKNSPLR